MTDSELILFLWNLLWDDLSDGDTPSDKDFEIIKEELLKRNLVSENFMEP